MKPIVTGDAKFAVVRGLDCGDLVSVLFELPGVRPSKMKTDVSHKGSKISVMSNRTILQNKLKDQPSLQTEYTNHLDVVVVE